MMTFCTPVPKIDTTASAMMISGKRHDDVEHALQPQIDLAAEIGAADPDHQAAEAADHGRGQADDKGGARAVTGCATSRSRPSWSVPSQCAQLGGSVIAAKSLEVGL